MGQFLDTLKKLIFYKLNLIIIHKKSIFMIKFNIKKQSSFQEINLSKYYLILVLKHSNLRKAHNSSK